MSKILIISLQVSKEASKGHFNPLIGVVQWLKHLGHEVIWLSLPRSLGEKDRRQVNSFGVEVIDAPTLEIEMMSGEEMARTALDPEQAWRVYNSFLIKPVASQVDQVTAILDRVQPDVVALDCMVYTGMIACHIKKVPYVGICAGLKILKAGDFDFAYMSKMEPLIEPRRKLFADYGMNPEFRLLECVSPWLNIVFTTKEFVGEIELPPKTRLVGPSTPPQDRGDEPDFLWDQLDLKRPLVYAAFGSVHTKLPLRDVILPIAQATKDIGAQLLLSSEALSKENYLTEFSNVVVVPYAPQLQILEKASAFITHGGANSVMEGLYYGVPLLLIPLSGDQPWQAYFLEKSQAGIAISRESLSLENCHEALQKLIGEVYRDKIAVIQDSYRKSDGARKAAMDIVALAELST